MKVRFLALPFSVVSVALLSCSDAPPQPPAAGVLAVLQNPSAADNPQGRTCKVGSTGDRTYKIGQPNASGTVENGKDGVEVACTVKDDGSVSIRVKGNNQTTGLPGTFTIDLGGRVVSKTDPAPNDATMGFFDAQAGQMRTTASTPPCKLKPPSGQPITLKAGALIADFECPIIISQDNPADGCRATGSVAVEYCKTGEEED